MTTTLSGATPSNSTPDPPTAGSQTRRAPRRYALVGLAALAAVASVWSTPRVSSVDRRIAVADLLTKQRGWSVAASDVVFFDRPAGLFGAAFGWSRVVVRARAQADEPSDVYLLEARLSPSGALLDLRGERNLSDTTGADETRPLVAGTHVVFASNSGVAGAPSVVTALDFAGQPKQPWTMLERVQTALSNWQETGQLAGVARTSFAVSGSGEVALAIEAGRVIARSDSLVADLPVLRDDDAPLPPWITRESTELSRPGNVVTWSVDRVRAEIGDERMQAIKQVAFSAKEFVDRNREELSNDNGAEDIADDLGTNDLAVPTRTIPSDPELGWPPAPLEPWIQPALPGEGQWNAKDDAAFHRSQPNLPSTFLTTFIRSDATRKTTRVYVVLWDPRQVELHMMAGTVEPKGATGKAGPGLVPRTPDVMKRVVAATNAGFQALHGEYGMMAEGVVYLPPKPYAATVMKLRDGSTAFGTWPDDPTVPDDVVSYRQNMTVMVQDEKFNPYNRTWWGGTVPGAEDKTHTVRTGICLTKEGFVAYFYGADLSPDALAQAMIQTRCSYGLALDMNAGHSGLEFYKVAPAAELGDPGRALETSWEAEGDVPDLPGYRFRAKRLVKGMGLMNFPRYIKREARDFFYLTLRHILPGENLAPPVHPPLEGEGTWRVKGLPQHGFPYALATTTIRPDANDPVPSFTILALDPRTVAPSTLNGSDSTVLTVDPGTSRGGPAVWWSQGAFLIGATAPSPKAVRLVDGAADATSGAAVVGIHGESGMMYYAELRGAEAGKRVSLASMQNYLRSIGCAEVAGLDEPWKLVLGDNTSLAGVVASPPQSPTSVRLARATAPRGTRFFEGTPVVPRDVWYPLQQHRVRYFKKAD
jgi:hypothetical protein